VFLLSLFMDSVSEVYSWSLSALLSLFVKLPCKGVIEALVSSFKDILDELKPWKTHYADEPDSSDEGSPKPSDKAKGKRPRVDSDSEEEVNRPRKTPKGGMVEPPVDTKGLDKSTNRDGGKSWDLSRYHTPNRVPYTRDDPLTRGDIRAGRSTRIHPLLPGLLPGVEDEVRAGRPIPRITDNPVDLWGHYVGGPALPIPEPVDSLHRIRNYNRLNPSNPIPDPVFISRGGRAIRFDSLSIREREIHRLSNSN
jgi:hypothetical protein